MNDKLTDFIKVYDDAVLPAHCDEIVDVFNASRDKLENHNTPLYKFKQLNLNQHQEHAGLVQAIAGTMVNVFNKYFHELEMLEWIKIEAMEEIRIKKYNMGTDDRFDTHVDVGDMSTAARFCTAIVYLNDNDGETYFPTLNYSVKPKKGRAIVFPPTWQYPHGGKSPTDNNKYIMMTSLHYAKPKMVSG